MLQHGKNQTTALLNHVLWSHPSPFTQFNTAQKISITSDHTQDDPGGWGAHEVTLRGIDETFQPLEEVVILQGLTPVETSNKFLRIQDMRVTKAGASETNQGTIKAIWAARHYATILPEETLSRQAYVMIPEGKMAVLTALECTSENPFNLPTEIALHAYEFSGTKPLKLWEGVMFEKLALHLTTPLLLPCKQGVIDVMLVGKTPSLTLTQTPPTVWGSINYELIDL